LRDVFGKQQFLLLCYYKSQTFKNEEESEKTFIAFSSPTKKVFSASSRLSSPFMSSWVDWISVKSEIHAVPKLGYY